VIKIIVEIRNSTYKNRSFSSNQLVAEFSKKSDILRENIPKVFKLARICGVIAVSEIFQFLRQCKP
jgi:hypothetical protein